MGWVQLAICHMHNGSLHIALSRQPRALVVSRLAFPASHSRTVISPRTARRIALTTGNMSRPARHERAAGAVTRARSQRVHREAGAHEKRAARGLPSNPRRELRP
jgi:hypothetical protein